MKVLQYLIFKMVFLTSFLFAQESKTVEIIWQENFIATVNGMEVSIPTLSGQLGQRIPYFKRKTKLPSKASYSFQITGVKTVSAQPGDEEYLKSIGEEITDKLNFNVHVSSASKQLYEVVSGVPFVREGGQLKRIVELAYQVSTGPQTAGNTAKSFKLFSELRDGTGMWYKLSISEDGLHKIDHAFLTSIGAVNGSISSNDIHLFGNADGKLPEQNNLPRTDDLAMNAIYVVDGGDGMFDDGDYLVFYGWGPSKWSLSGGLFDQDMNIYSDYACYFINIDPNKTPMRVQNLTEALSPNQVVNSYSYRDVHENDWINPVSGGQRFYGEEFDINLTQSFTFPAPNLVSGTASTIRSAICSNATASAGGTQRYYINNNLVLTKALPTGSEYPRDLNSLSFNSSSNNVVLRLEINRQSPDVITYMDRLVLNTRRNLVMWGSQFSFRDLESVGPGNVSEFQVSGLPAEGFIWDITNKHAPSRLQGQLVGSLYTFIQETDTLREFVASDGVNFLTPRSLGRVEPQNLHGLPQVDYVIVSHPSFMAQANRLADLHRSQGTSVHVVTTTQVYNEFSGGMQDPTAIKFFMKMFYDRSVSLGNAPKYLCLFGDGTFDHRQRKGNSVNYVPTYQVVGAVNYEDHINNMVADDYYGFLDDSEGTGGSDLLDISVGRMLVSSTQSAKELVDKVEHYMKNGSTLFAADNVNCLDGNSTSTFGDWRQKIVNSADDGNGGIFVSVDCEPRYNYVKTNHPEFNQDKLYLDAFKQITTAGGERYPEVYEAITNRIERGCLIFNYVGHGGEVGLANERVVTVEQIQAWKNIDNMPLFVSATCEFSKYDDPDRVSAGEWASLNPLGGAIALMTTTRPIYISVNTQVIKAFYEEALKRDASGKPLTFGEIIRNTKLSAVAGNNELGFTLIGDPALRIAIPQHRMVVDSINGLVPGVALDTLEALSKVRIVGHIEDQNGNPLNTFNGIAIPSIYDKPKNLMTLGQDSDTPALPYELQQNVVYRGKSTITNGSFSFEFIVPKDIDYSWGNGKISLYGYSNSVDGLGEEQRVMVGGINPNGLNDNEGPEVELYLNNANFVNGGITDETPFLIARLFDESGINTVGSGIGHDVIAVLDGNTAKPIVLNDYYSADLDTYKSGEIRYQFPKLEAGEHTLDFIVWDVNNNSSRATLNFVVQEDGSMVLDRVLNYPNPFTTRTEFFFEHNQCCTNLETQIQIFTVSGRLVKTINQVVYTTGYRSEGIVWDGRDEFGDQLAKGVYVYRLKVKTPDGESAEKIEKLVLLK